MRLQPGPIKPSQHSKIHPGSGRVEIRGASSFSKRELSSPAGALSIITPGANVKPSHYRWNAVNSGGFGGLAPHFHNQSEATKILKC
jgi:hypothetical protein